MANQTVEQLTSTLRDPKEANGPCYFCAEIVDNERWCYGCLHYICNSCDGDELGQRPIGGNHYWVGDHLEAWFGPLFTVVEGHPLDFSLVLERR